MDAADAAYVLPRVLLVVTAAAVCVTVVASLSSVLSAVAKEFMMLNAF